MVAYVGVLYILGGITSIGLATALWLREDARVIAAGAAIAAGMAVGFVLSRTRGLAAWQLLRATPLRRQLAG
jgi:hypothetical protein